MGETQKPVFITGGSGSIGSRLAQRFIDSGQAVRLLVRDPSRAKAFQGIPDVELVRGDLSDPDSLHGCMEGCGLVYHIAGKLSGSNAADYEQVNVKGTEALLQEAVRAGVERFIHTSTIGVYSMSQDKNITEDHPWVPSNTHYIKTKQQSEKVAWDYAGQLPMTVARPGEVIGPGQQSWCVLFIEMIQKGQLRPPRAKESGVISPVYVDNLIDAYLLLGSHPAAVGQAFNIVDGWEMLFSQYIHRLGQMAGKTSSEVPVFLIKSVATVMMAMDLLRGREARVPPENIEFLLKKSTFSNAKICNLLGWSPAIGQEEAFRRLEAWFREAGYLPAGSPAGAKAGMP